MFKLYQKVLVYREDNRSAIKAGIILEIGTTHLRIWDHKNDPLSYAAEWFPVLSKRVWVKASS